jgi:type III pantothenate kinase
MILLIDIGNTNTVCSIYYQKKYILLKRIDLKDNILKTLNKFDNHNIKKIAISSVVPELTKYFIKILKIKYEIKPYVISHNNANIKLDVDDKNEVGNDRICNVKAAIELTKKDCLVIDFGTATTYDVINNKQEFIGGAIAPGIDISANYLIKKAALLKNTTFKFPKNIIGKNTSTNIQSGVMFGAISSIEGMISMIQDEVGSELYIILTGGFSQLISSKLSYKHILKPNLTLDGIRLIYNENNE